MAFDQHVNGCEQIVAAADVAEFVRQDGFEFSVIEVAADAGGEPEDRAEDAEDAGLKFGGGGDHGRTGQEARPTQTGAALQWGEPGSHAFCGSAGLLPNPA